MKNYQLRMKKVATVATLAVFTFTSMASAQGSVFKDLDTTSPYAKDAIVALAEKNVIQGDNGYFNPAKTTSRAEMITMIVRALGIDTEDVPTEATFKDVPVDHWAFKYVEAAFREGIVEGVSEDEFGKELETTREQMAAMFVRALGVSPEDLSTMEFPNIEALKDKDQISAWAIGEVEIALSEGLMMGMGENEFAPKGSAKREQVAVVVDRFITNVENIAPEVPTETPEEAPIAEELVALYNALVKSQSEYKGEIKTNFNFEIIDPANEGSFIMNMEETKQVNGTSIHSTGKMIMEIDGETMEEPIESITIGNKFYMKDFTEDLWLELDLEEGMQEEIEVINEDFMKNFNSLNIVKEGEADLEGTSATKYVLTLTGEEANALMPADYTEIYTFMMEEEESNDVEFVFEFYVDENEDVIKMNYAFDAIMEMEGEILEFNMFLEMNFTNIGTEYTITAPENTHLLIIEE